MGKTAWGKAGESLTFPGLVLNWCIRGRLTRQVVLAAGARAKAPEPAPTPRQADGEG